MIKRNAVLFFCAIVCLTLACKEDLYFQSKKEIPAALWAYQDSLDFTFEILDTSAIYNLYLDIEHSTEYPFQNVYLQVYTLFPSGKRDRQRLNIDFADKTGRWYGKCNSEECRLRVFMQESVYFAEQGAYTITLKQFTREDTLSGIMGMRIALAVQDDVERNAN
ncbi:MAG TPA: gliding motility lipoprotein GldH [Phaeodactylibacter sp.]|nr:gliding motility lipoprotein GldH [Phaeodactylibacter sp.]